MEEFIERHGFTISKIETNQSIFASNFKMYKFSNMGNSLGDLDSFMKSLREFSPHSLVMVDYNKEEQKTIFTLTISYEDANKVRK